MDTTAEQIYHYYPRLVGKLAALRAIEKALKDKSAEYLTHAVREYAAATKAAKTPRKYIPHPATWFNAGRYDDDRDEWWPDEEIDATSAWATLRGHIRLNGCPRQRGDTDGLPREIVAAAREVGWSRLGDMTEYTQREVYKAFEVSYRRACSGQPGQRETWRTGGGGEAQ